MADEDAATSPVNVVRLDIERAADVGGALARAFQHDPIQSAVIPDADRRSAMLPCIFTALLRGTAASHGEILTTTDAAAAALWHPPGVRLKVSAMLRAYGLDVFRVIGSTPVRSYPGMIAMFSTLERQRKVHMPRPHWYLAVLGVDPDHQGRGLGTALVRAGLGRAADVGVAAYVEAETESNVAFYEALRFTVLERVHIERLRLPMWLMARDPA